MRKLVALFFLFFLLTLTFTTIPIKAQTYYHYSFYGPQWDTGYYASGNTIACQVLWANSSSYYFSLNADNNIYNSNINITTYTKINQIIWNDSSAMNLTRSIVFQNNTNTATEYLRITNPAYTVGIYTFMVTDFYGMQEPYLRISHSDNGIGDLYIIEQADLFAGGSPSFTLQQYQTYTLSFICTQGQYNQQFFAANTYTVSLPITSGIFESTTENISIATAQRTTPTNLQIKYNDPDLATTALTVTVSHIVNGVATNDMVDTVSTNNYLYNFIAVNTTDYNIRIQATRYGSIMEWNLVAPVPTGYTNPFTGIFDFLGTWPAGFDPSQIVGICIIAMFLVIGSFRTSGVSCLLACLVAGILTAIGWFTIGIPLLVISIVISIIVMMAEGKETAREA